jgi:cyanophycinase-like exopeptidase
MVTVHKRLADRLPADRRCVLLETPYLFQTNSSGVTAKAETYFARSVGLRVTATPGTGTDTDVAAIRAADWLFAGPGSPTYALRHWRAGPVGDALRDRIRFGAGVTVFASAAAATIGCLAVPVYEVYKAGEEPRWLDGLDLLAGLGLRVVVIPHFNNTEGGTYDTRFCYLGEPRLLEMERALPDGVAVLGVDEHTALLVDLDTTECEVVGRGVVTVRRGGTASVLPAGTVLSVADLGRVTVEPDGRGAHVARPPDVDARPEAAAPTLRDAVAAAEARFAAATGPDGRAEAVLELEAAIHEWATDTDEDDGVEQARVVLRSLIVRLAGHPADGVPPALVDGLLTVRRELRVAGWYPQADAIRAALTSAGIQVQDGDGATTWTRDV